MSYIAPSSTVHLLSNVPLEPNFENTVWYNTEAEQEADFLRYKTLTLSNQSYVHKERGVIRVEATMSSIFGCNYMMFKNTQFENKWFYAFITHVEYVSNEVCDVYFAIDPIQTWLKRFTIDPCFIAREHTYTDKQSDWIIPENVSVGPYVFYDYDSLYSPSDMCYVIAAPFTINYAGGTSPVTIGNFGSAFLSGGVPSGVHYTVYDNIIDLAHVLYELTNTVDSPSGSTGNAISEVINVFIAPRAMFTQGTAGSDPYIVDKQTTIPSTRTTIPANATMSSPRGESYTIKNKKLNAYPFRYFLCTDHAGSDGILKPELFKESVDFLTFYAVGDNSPDAGIIISPEYYKGWDTDTSTGYDKTTFFKFGHFPTITWTVDVWKSWLSSTGVENAVSRIREAFTGVETESKIEAPQLYGAGDILQPGVGIKDALGMISENARRRQEYNSALNAQNPYSLSAIISGKTDLLGGAVDFGLKIGGAFSVLRGVVNNLSQYYQQSLKPNTVGGSQTGTARLNMGNNTFDIIEFGITKERAQTLDQFFTAYGYATNRFGKPYLFDDVSKSRPYINFVQTAGANVNGNLPKDSADAIAAIFDAGVRFWTGQSTLGHANALDNVNNYELDNSPPLG